jgi:hypothetical protein
VPRSYQETCRKGGCSTDTAGVVEHGGTATPATWPGEVPLGLTFPVRGPAWSWYTGSELIGSTGQAIELIVAGALLDMLAIVLLVALVRLLGRRRRAVRWSSRSGS